MNIQININDNIKFNNKATHCIGTGRMDLAMHKEYLDQLKLVQDEIGFEYIRGHGLFSKYMGIYRENRFTDNKPEYCFTYLDMVMDSYKELNIKPLLELGFMPDDLASGDNKVFFWQGNVTPPKDYDKFADLITATLKHLMERYGEDYVLTWPVEVWNEPNLPTFWKDADMQEYFKLYEVASAAVKRADERFKVGGPAICGVDDERWLKAFLDFVKEKKLPLDFVSRHHYTSYNPKISGHYAYIDLHEPEYAFGCVERSRDIVDSYEEFKNKEIFITEFNTSYVPNAPIHDTVLNAAYVAHMLSKLGDKHDSYSYWTFGDVFEEMGVAPSEFHGGFGLVANGLIPKPTFWTFAFYKKLQGRCVQRNENSVAVVTDEGDVRVMLWNPDLHNEGKSFESVLELENMQNGEYLVTEKFIDENNGNPLKLWHEMGEPSSPDANQKAMLKEIAKPGFASSNLITDNGKILKSVCLNPNEIRFMEFKRIIRKSDSGYDYNKTIRQVAVPDNE